MGYKNYNSFLISFLQFWYYPFLQQKKKKNGKKEKILAVWKLIPCLLKSNYIHILNKHICVCQNTISRVEYRVRVLSFRTLSVFGYASKQTCALFFISRILCPRKCFFLSQITLFDPTDPS